MAQSYQAEIQRDPTGLYNQPIDLSGELGDKAHFVYDDVNKVYSGRAYSRDGRKYTYTYEIDPAKQTFGRKSAIYDTPEDAARHYWQAYQADPQHAMNVYQVRNADGTVRTIKLEPAEFNTDRQRGFQDYTSAYYPFLGLPKNLGGSVTAGEVRANPEKYNVQVKSAGGTLNYFNYLK